MTENFPSMLLYAATNLAPEIRFHSKEQFGPCSIEWLLSRSDLTEGTGSLTWALGGQPIYIPNSMSVRTAGPLSVADLVAATSSTTYSDSARNKDIGLWPMAAPPGQAPTYTRTTITHWYYSDYQLNTFRGEIPPTGTSTDATGAACYAHISAVQQGADSFTGYLVSYYFLCAYNGAMGPTTNWTAPPLAGTGGGGGFEQHYGDVMRVGAQLTFDPIAATFSLIGVEFDAHGTTTVVTDPPFAFTGLTYDEIPPLTVYSAWHSHEMYPTAGTFSDPASPIPGVVHDYTDDDGLHWHTRNNLVFLTSGNPSWVNYNGQLGGNVTITDLVDILTTGPCGPAFKSDWQRGQEIDPSLTGRLLRITSDPAGAVYQFSGDLDDLDIPVPQSVAVATGGSVETLCINSPGSDFGTLLSLGEQTVTIVAMPQNCPSSGYHQTQSDALAVGADGTLDYFLVNDQQTISSIHRAADGTWRGANNAFGAAGRYLGDGIAAINAGNSTVHLFYSVTDGDILHSISTQTGSWSSPVSVFAAAAKPGQVEFCGALAAVISDPSELQLLFTSNNQSSSMQTSFVWSMALDLASGTWSTPEQVPLPFAAVNKLIAAVPAAASDSPRTGALTLFAVGLDANEPPTYSVTEISRNSDGTWTSPASVIPGTISAGSVATIGSLGAWREADGSISVTLAPLPPSRRG